MNIPRLIGFAIVFAIIALVIHSVGAYIEMPYYLDETYFPVWSELMMPAAGPPGTEFFAVSIVFNTITGFLFGLVFTLLRGGIPGNRKGLMFGFLIFLVATLPMTMSLYLLISLPWELIILWAVQGLVIFLIGGWIAEKIIK